MNNVLALINLYPRHKLGFLTDNRPMGSTTLLARYAFLDFTLSNLTNSNIDTIGIMVRKNANSIYKHIGSSSTYLSNAKTGSMHLLINEKGLNNPVFNTDLNNLRENDFILYDQTKKYIVITNVHFMMKMDYSKIVDAHINSGHQVSFVYKTVEKSGDFKNAKKVISDNMGNAQKIYKDDTQGESKVLLDTIVINRELLLKLLYHANGLSDFADMNDFEQYLLSYVHDGVNLIEFNGFVAFFDSFDKYFKYTLRILDDEEILKSFFADKDWIYYTTTHNMSPVKYASTAKVSKSLIANGSDIRGTVKNCVLARDVVVEEGAVLENCIIFSHCHIGKNIKLKNLVADKRVSFEYLKQIEGTEDKPLYFPRGAKV